MLPAKFFNCGSVSRLISYQFKRSDKFVLFRSNKYFLSRNEVFQQPYHPFFLSKHSNFFKNWCLSPRKYFSISHNLLEKTSKHDTSPHEEPEKLSLVNRYKKMLKEYWYVLIPVHIVTSTMWFGLFYYLAKSGIDIVPLLKLLNLPDKIIQPFQNSSLGHIAVASAFYKLFTPARYMVTLGGTTISIKQLTKRGLIKPVPTKAEFKTLIQKKLQQKADSVKKKS